MADTKCFFFGITCLTCIIFRARPICWHEIKIFDHQQPVVMFTNNSGLTKKQYSGKALKLFHTRLSKTFFLQMDDKTQMGKDFDI